MTVLLICPLEILLLTYLNVKNFLVIPRAVKKITVKIGKIRKKSVSKSK